MLYLIGLGLSWKDLSLKALEVLQKCDKIYLENYTSVSDFSKLQLERLLGKKIEVLNRKQVEEVKPFLKHDTAALLIYGDPLAATTHIEFLNKAKVIHAPSILTAVAETGLQLYKFGKTASIPIPEKNFKPESFYDILEENQKIGAHTLFLLDLRPEEDEFLSIKQAIGILFNIEKKRKLNLFRANTKCIACARLGQSTQLIKYGTAKRLQKINFGKPPYCLIVPGKLNFKEKEFLESL